METELLAILNPRQTGIGVPPCQGASPKTSTEVLPPIRLSPSASSDLFFLSGVVADRCIATPTGFLTIGCRL